MERSTWRTASSLRSARGIPVGTTLGYTNDGSVAHTASASDASWDTATAAGQTISVTFNQAGPNPG
jgi:plastocyanin